MKEAENILKNDEEIQLKPLNNHEEEGKKISTNYDQSYGNNTDPMKFTNKLEQRRKEKRQNKFDRVILRQRIESVKKLRSQSRALTGDLEGLRLVIGKSQLTNPNLQISKSILSKVNTKLS